MYHILMYTCLALNGIKLDTIINTVYLIVFVNGIPNSANPAIKLNNIIGAVINKGVPIRSRSW